MVETHRDSSNGNSEVGRYANSMKNDRGFHVTRDIDAYLTAIANFCLSRI